MNWVFAYGSNMHLPDLCRWLRERGYDDVGPTRVEPACVSGFRLAWNYHSAVRVGGAANAAPRDGAELLGLALHVSDDLLAALDRKEGHPTRYDRGDEPVPARLLRDGSTVRSWLYRVTPAFVSATDVPPRAAYLRLLLEAAETHALGAEYVQRLRRVPTLD